MELWYSQLQTDNIKFSIKVKEHLYTGKSPYQQIDIFDSEEMGIFLIIDGIVMLTSKDEFIYHDMIVHVPLATNPAIKKALVIGGGDGGTVRELTRYSSIEKIDMVEIDEMVVAAAKKFLPLTAGRLDDPRVSLYFEDGAEFLRNTKEKYDLIIVDSTDPIGPGEGLFTNEFYQNCYNALTDDGILVNQCESPFYEKNAKEMRRAISKINRLFPISEVYQYHMPTYPSGHWLFGFASKKFHPLHDFRPEKWTELGIETKYYNTDVHRGAFMLPTYVREQISRVEKSE
ncbi:Polyamine aminopropyltransferase [Neobacillus rhizosphaerae]|uniref:Polyamine aminopropyltransferase n=1 Tax=Neobacillus rhizosphaerae TaxID=2880965 RepID=A0ABN8KMF9_9BACI|nr:polyamine aminopropyltransferase [Neobacillus rhizosphaerae]CAH2714706.1 Polyamine aminopropyltransferase [Neobacillus rhizosphaerae]